MRAVGTPAIVLFCTLVLLVPGLAIPNDIPVDIDEPSLPGQTLRSGDDTVRIVRTAEGIPHIYAETAEALGFGNGYAQAEDRLFQLHVLRLVGKGEAASALGPGFLSDDLQARRDLYTHEERVAAYQALPQETRELFDGYAAGVNRFIVEATLDPTRMPVEFAAVAAAPEPWQVTDTIAVAQYLLDLFGAAGGAELTNALLHAHLRDTLGHEAGLAAFDDAVWLEHPLATTSIPADEGVYIPPGHTTGWDDIPPEQQNATIAATHAEAFGGGDSLDSHLPQQLPFKMGSNAVIVAGDNSTSGGALLGGGPQMGYFSPMVPYEVGLHGAGFDVAGIGVGGAPGVVIGRTADFSWTVTSGIGDQVDVVGVRLVDGEPRKYHHDGSILDMDCRTESHIVRAPPPLSEAELYAHAENNVYLQEVCRTIHGPVFAMNETDGWAFAKERSHRYKEIDSGVRWLSLGKQTDLDGFLTQLDDFAFTFNFHYVDADNIAYIHTGHQPERDPRLDPRLPRPGTGEYEWTGIRTGEDLPRTINPARGWIVNWNNQPQQGWTGGGDQRELFGSVHRVDLLKERMEAGLAEGGGQVSLDDVARVVREAGTRDPFARHTLPYAIEAWADYPGEIDKSVHQAMVDWADTDYSWDTQNETHHPGQTIYQEYRTQLQELVFRDELGDHTRTMGWDPPNSDDVHGGDYAQHRNKDGLLLDALEGRTTQPWCDNVTTSFTESCADMVTHALHLTIHTLMDRYNSTDAQDWRMPAIKNRFVAISASPAWEIPLQNRASYNHLHDWGVEGNRDAQSVMPPGAKSGYWNLENLVALQSGGELHEHARDQLDLYVAWEYKPLRFFEDEVEGE